MKKIMIVTCSSFTTIVLFFVFFSRYQIVPVITNHIILQLFAMSFTIAIGMALTDYVEKRKDISSMLFDVVLRAAICYGVVLLEGSLFGMFTFAWRTVWEISPILIPTFIVTYVISLISLMEVATSINQTISRKEKGGKPL